MHQYEKEKQRRSYVTRALVTKIRFVCNYIILQVKRRKRKNVSESLLYPHREKKNVGQECLFQEAREERN